MNFNNGATYINALPNLHSLTIKNPYIHFEELGDEYYLHNTPRIFTKYSK